MEVAVVTGGATRIVTDLGRGTSTEAEWLALIHALRVARSLDFTEAVLLGDSADVVAKANGKVPCRGTCATHLQSFRSLLDGIAAPRVRYIKRSQNLAGIALAGRHRL
ncbi:ribonuclease H family protein [Sphingomonas sp.]|uniref:ribonuclease H family protein n=1 Tax=Sphingomonas sp. TaxID=28214 RepID=UPI002D804A84|nr:ribonuclease H family protein [Sphingomonas sp.]HEU0045240.1 ribonuclease H family protein [Sphingomonas sp.]